LIPLISDLTTERSGACCARTWLEKRIKKERRRVFIGEIGCYDLFWKLKDINSNGSILICEWFIWVITSPRFFDQLLRNKFSLPGICMFF
jgi:hypothetical protein